LSYLPTCLWSLLFVNLFIWLTTSYQSHSSKTYWDKQPIPRFLWNPNFQEPNSSNAIIYLQELIKNTFITAFKRSLTVWSLYQNSTIISVQSNKRYMHCPSNPPFRSTAQNMKLIVTMFSSHTLSQLHPHIFTVLITIYIYIWVVNLFDVLCLCDTLYCNVH